MSRESFVTYALCTSWTSVYGLCMRIKGSNVISVMALFSTILGAQYLEGLDRAKKPAISKAPVVKAVPKPAQTVYQTKMVDCEDRDVQPCWTNDEGQFRIVYSYIPYKARVVVLCKEEDGGPVLPCLWKDNNAGEKPGFQTRNYFWSKTF